MESIDSKAKEENQNAQEEEQKTGDGGPAQAEKS